MPLVLTNAARSAILDGMVEGAAPGPGALSNAFVGLYTDGPNPYPGMSYASFTPASFDGYAVSPAVVWSAVFGAEDGTPQVAGSTQSFIATGSTVAESVKGYMLLTGTGPNYTLLGAEDFADLITITVDGQGIVIVPVVAVTSNDWGQVETVS